MPNINGDWYHTRSSSNLNELLTVRAIINESQRIEYAGLIWTGGRQNNQRLYDLAHIANLEPSTLQTKVRAMIIYGFVRENNSCPIVWTRMGRLWNDLYTVGNLEAAKKIYQLTLSLSLAIYSFNNTSRNFSYNPSEGDRPLQFLLNNLHNNTISFDELRTLIDGNTNRVGNNFSYWKSDLLNSGLFQENGNLLTLTNNYNELVEVIRTYIPNPDLLNEDWNLIRDNPLSEISPFAESFRTIFQRISEEQDINNEIGDRIITEPIIEVVSEQEEMQIPEEVDILSTNTRFTQANRRIRNATWSLRIRNKYNNRCAVPNCDTDGRMFVEAAHIKPDNIQEEGTPHRTHILNGICLCKNCHIAFDKGYFTLSNDYRLIHSHRKFSEIVDQHLKTVIIQSEGEIIRNRVDNRMPLQEFVTYHREHIYEN